MKIRIKGFDAMPAQAEILGVQPWSGTYDKVIEIPDDTATFISFIEPFWRVAIERDGEGNLYLAVMDAYD